MPDPMRLEYRKLTEIELGAVRTIKERAAELYGLIDTIPPSREVSLAKTKLEEAVMWATKAIT